MSLCADIAADLEAAIQTVRDCARDAAMSDPGLCNRLYAMAMVWEADLAKVKQLQASAAPQDPFAIL